LLSFRGEDDRPNRHGGPADERNDLLGPTMGGGGFSGSRREGEEVQGTRQPLWSKGETERPGKQEEKRQGDAVSVSRLAGVQGTRSGGVDRRTHGVEGKMMLRNLICD